MTKGKLKPNLEVIFHFFSRWIWKFIIKYVGLRPTMFHWVELITAALLL